MFSTQFFIRNERKTNLGEREREKESALTFDLFQMKLGT